MIVVTTPTGEIGRQLVPILLGAGEPLRLIVRDPSRLSDEVRSRAEIVEGSHGDAAVVDEAFAGADAVFWVVPPDPHTESLEATYLDFTRPACAATARHGVGHMVDVTALGRGTPWQDRAGLLTVSIRMDDLLAATGAAHRALAMPSFMDNMLRQLQPIRDQELFFGPLDGDLKAPTCATRDIAAAAAQLLIDRSWSGQADVHVLGPEDLSSNDMGSIMSEVLGKPVRYQQTLFDAFEAQLRSQGMSDAFVQGYVAMMHAKAEGVDTAQPRTPDATTPTTFRQWCEAVLKPAMRG